MTPINFILFRWTPVLITTIFIPCHDLSATDHPSQTLAPTSGFIVNPQATYSFLGNGYLGRALGLDRDSALQLGGYLIPEVDWVVSGGVEPNTAYGSLAFGLHAKVDLEKVLNIPVQPGAWNSWRPREGTIIRRRGRSSPIRTWMEPIRVTVRK
jgi:hypothetical protein